MAVYIQWKSLAVWIGCIQMLLIRLLNRNQIKAHYKIVSLI